MTHISLADGHGIAALARVQRNGLIRGVAGLIGVAGVFFAHDLVSREIEACGDVADGHAPVHHILIAHAVAQAALGHDGVTHLHGDLIVNIVVIGVQQSGILGIGIPAEAAGANEVVFMQGVAAAPDSAGIAALLFHQFPRSLRGAAGAVFMLLLAAVIGAVLAVIAAAGVGVFMLLFAAGIHGFLIFPLGIGENHAGGLGVSAAAVGNVAHIVGIGSGAGCQHADVEETCHHRKTHCKGDDSSSKNFLCHYFVLLSNLGSETSAAAPA